ncbi:hypothetical protein LNP74_07815 [Klebsiella pneumoniae subsp. pneumoniae]|nr:hypothetical protein [Klebsiella pneumoniae subsp. pneumoniae]
MRAESGFLAGLAPASSAGAPAKGLPGGMISVVVKGDRGYAERIISKLRWFTLAEPGRRGESGGASPPA